MALYCLCREDSGPLIDVAAEQRNWISKSVPVPDDAPTWEREGRIYIKEVHLESSMVCVKTGASQTLHVQNVDIFRCPRCGTRIARE